VLVVTENRYGKRSEVDEYRLIKRGGKIIRMPMRDLRVIGRNTQGVRLFKLDEGEKVVAVDRMAEIISEDEEGEDVETSSGE